MITLRNLCLRRGSNILLENINWTIYQTQHIGIIGANGSGKSSFFSLLLNTLEADLGEVEIPKKYKIAHVEQETPAYTRSALDYVLDGDIELRELEKHLEKAEQNHDGMKISELHEQLGNIDAYTAPSRAAQLLDGLGFSAEEQQRAVSAFSGGWRVRLNIAKALMCRSDILLLDEPTNHLDLDAVIWLEQWLKRYSGTLLLISHDRDFLDSTVDHIAHFDQQSIKSYAGNYSAFEKQRAEHLLIQQAVFEKQQKKIAHLQSFINRFKAKASKAPQAQSRMKALEKMELVSAVQIDSPFQFTFKSALKAPNPLLKLIDATLGYATKEVLHDVNLVIGQKDRIGILGPNGAGKSTLIKTLAGDLPPLSGIIEPSAGLKIGYFAQHQVDQLQLNEHPLHHLKSIAPGVSEVELRTFLGTFDFVGDRVFQPVKLFSGGEKSRLALALIVWQKPNLLLLDEPTNHLDLEMRQALSMALQDYEGAMLLVSHDRFLLRSTVDNFILVSHQVVTPFEGDLADYEKWLSNYRKQNSTQNIKKPQETSKKLQRQLNAKQRESLKTIQKDAKELEAKLSRLNSELGIIEISLNDTTLYEAHRKIELQVLLANQANLKKQLEETEMAWLTAMEKRDANDTGSEL